MTILLRKLCVFSLLIMFVGIISCLSGTDVTSTEQTAKAEAITMHESVTEKPAVLTSKANADFEVYKSPTCSCCVGWIEHLHESGYSTTITDLKDFNDLQAMKAQYGIAAENRSCHTAVSPDGYVFEGHVPAKFIKRFMSEKPEGAIGLSVPAMPIGTPGMEMGDKFTPYKLLLLKKDGSSEVYADIKTAAEQF